MRRIALVNQKGGVGKTTSTVNLGAALARLGRRVVLVDLDPQANLSMHLGLSPAPDELTTYSVLSGAVSVEQALRPSKTPGMRVLPANIDLSGAELELASALGRERILADALSEWEASEGEGADYVLIDCPPSLGLLSINGLVASREALVTIQTAFLALQGTSRLVEVVDLLRRRLNPELSITGILPCMYDNRTRLAREVLGEIRAHFPREVFQNPIHANIKLAEAPSFGQTIFEYAPESRGARDYLRVAQEVLAQEPGEGAPAAREEPGSASERVELRQVDLVPPGEPTKVADAAPASGSESGAVRGA